MNQTPSRPAPTNSFRLFGCRIDRLSPSEILSRASEALEQKSFFHIITGNALMLLEARDSVALQSVFENSDLVTIESSGLSLASRLFRGESMGRLAGIDLALQLCEMAAKKNLSVFLFGGKPGVAENAVTFFSRKIPALKVAGTRNGFFAEEQSVDIARQIKDSGAGLILVALGMPRQEMWIAAHKSQLPPAVVMGVGGSFDIWSGRIKRAPQLFQSLGMEWLYRLLQEPYRLRRMLKLPLFALLVLFERISRRKSRV